MINWRKILLLNIETVIMRKSAIKMLKTSSKRWFNQRSSWNIESFYRKVSSPDDINPENLLFWGAFFRCFPDTATKRFLSGHWQLNCAFLGIFIFFLGKWNNCWSALRTFLVFLTSFPLCNWLGRSPASESLFEF